MVICRIINIFHVKQMSKIIRICVMMLKILCHLQDRSTIYKNLIDKWRSIFALMHPNHQSNISLIWISALIPHWCSADYIHIHPTWCAAGGAENVLTPTNPLCFFFCIWFVYLSRSVKLLDVVGGMWSVALTCRQCADNTSQFLSVIHKALPSPSLSSFRLSSVSWRKPLSRLQGPYHCSNPSQSAHPTFQLSWPPQNNKFNTLPAKKSPSAWSWQGWVLLQSCAFNEAWIVENMMWTGLKLCDAMDEVPNPQPFIFLLVLWTFLQTLYQGDHQFCRIQYWLVCHILP